MGDRIKGQEVSIRVVDNGNLVASLDSIASFNEEMSSEIKEDGFLGESTNRYDDIHNGYKGDFEFQLRRSDWTDFQLRVQARQERRNPNIVFNVVRTDLYPDGTSTVFTYLDAKWGSMSAGAGSRADFVKAKAQFACSKRTVKQNALPLL
jgi:predicted RNA-binding protein (virulence factor B family)